MGISWSNSNTRTGVDRNVFALFTLSQPPPLPPDTYYLIMTTNTLAKMSSFRFNWKIMKKKTCAVKGRTNIWTALWGAKYIVCPLGRAISIFSTHLLAISRCQLCITIKAFHSVKDAVANAFCRLRMIHLLLRSWIKSSVFIISKIIITVY